MSPQVLQSAFYPTNTYDAVEADIWALGIVLCHLFFGAHTPYWLTPNAFRNENMTMHARIAAMKKQNWAESDEFVKANVTALSPELRGLLDKIFVADEFKRITLQGIKEHPWYKAELPPALQQALDDMAAEQAQRDSLERATVSLAANRHDTAEPATGDFPTIDLLVDLAQKQGKMPGSGADKVFCLDMAHMDLGPLSISTAAPRSPWGSPPPSPSAAAAAGDASIRGTAFGDVSECSSRWRTSTPAADISVRSSASRQGMADGATLDAAIVAGAVSPFASSPIDEHLQLSMEGTQHSAVSYLSHTDSLQRAVSAGDRSTHLSSVVGAPDLPTGRFKKTLSLKRSSTGLLVGRYVLEPSDHGGTLYANHLAATKGCLVSSSHGWQSVANNVAVAAEKRAASMHAGMAFFNEAAVRFDASLRGGNAAAATSLNHTVHGGTAHAVSKHNQTGPFYHG
eukprot:GHRR01018788.1.p1 GENE.GHRR01018788.1~~GHRR01018788.1.p1  ORF type:complete len:455 (+),score=139.31 GHRR01018788.1:2185-3549(+)